jgi:hypothetical protein
MKERIQYMYYIFVTPLGKGYGCFSIKNTEAPGVFEVSSSFCHPTDRKLFRKSIARRAADAHRDRPRETRIEKLSLMGKKTKVLVNVAPDEKGNFDTPTIVEEAIQQGVDMRSWAMAAYKRGLFYKTLKNDCATWAKMVMSLPNGFKLIDELKLKATEDFLY